MKASSLALLVVPTLLLAACATNPVPDVRRNPHPPLRDANAPVLEWYSQSGMDFGKGYDPAGGELKGTCVKGTISSTTVGNPSASYSLDIVTTTEELSKSLGVSAEASLDVGLYAASAKADYAQSSATNSYAVYVIARSDISGPEVTQQDVALLNAQESPNGFDYQSAYLNNYLQFYNACGDHYLASATTGATYRGVIRVESTSSDEQQSIKTELSGRYDAVSGSASVSRAVQEIATRYNVSVQEFYTGVIPSSFASDVPSLISNATNFPQLFQSQCQGSTVSGGALNCLQSATFQPYSTLVIGSPPLAQLQQVQQAIQNANTLTQYGVAYLVDYNNATFAQANPWLFINGQAALSSLATQASQNLNKVKDALNACSQNLAFCVSPSSLGLPDPSTVAGPSWINVGTATSCRDYQLKFWAASATSSSPNHPLNDGNYPIYVGGQTSRSARIWCTGMGTTAPTEYVSLVSLPNSPATNYSIFRDSQGNTMTTTYLKIRLNPATLALDLGDSTFANTSGSAVGSPDANNVPYAFASNCDVNATDNLLPTGKVDLTGTDFALPLSAFYTAGGGVATYLDLTTTRQQVTLQTGRAPSPSLCSQASANVDPEDFYPQLTLQLSGTN